MEPGVDPELCTDPLLHAARVGSEALEWPKPGPAGSGGPPQGPVRCCKEEPRFLGRRQFRSAAEQGAEADTKQLTTIHLWYRSGGERGCSSADSQRCLVQLRAQPSGGI